MHRGQELDRDVATSRLSFVTHHVDAGLLRLDVAVGRQQAHIADDLVVTALRISG